MDIQTMHIYVKLQLDKTSALELPAFEPEEIDYWLNEAVRKFVKTRYSGINSKKESFEETQKRIDDLRTLVKHYTDSTAAGSSDYTNGYDFQLPVDGSGIGDGDYWLTLGEACNIVVGSTETTVGVVQCTVDEYQSRVNDPFSEHVLHYQTAKPLRIFNGNSVELISDGNYTVDDYHLTYLRKPHVMSRDDVSSGSITAGVTYGVYNVSDTAYVIYNGNNYYNGETFIGVSGISTYAENGTNVVNISCDLPEHTHDEIVKLAANMMLENIEQPRYQTHMNEVNTME